MLYDISHIYPQIGRLCLPDATVSWLLGDKTWLCWQSLNKAESVILTPFWSSFLLPFCECYICYFVLYQNHPFVKKYENSDIDIGNWVCRVMNITPEENSNWAKVLQNGCISAPWNKLWNDQVFNAWTLSYSVANMRGEQQQTSSYFCVTKTLCWMVCSGSPYVWQWSRYFCAKFCVSPLHNTTAVVDVICRE